MADMPIEIEEIGGVPALVHSWVGAPPPLRPGDTIEVKGRSLQVVAVLLLVDHPQRPTLLFRCR